MMLVATDKAAASKPAVPGEVTIGGQSRIVIEPGDETVRVYYLLTIQNGTSSPVNPSKAFSFEMPTGAIGTSLLDGSSPQASVIGPRVVVQGPFAPGGTSFEVACELPVASGTLDVTTHLPAKLEQLSVLVKKLGATKLSSPSVTNQQDMNAGGETYIAASGGAVPAGQAIQLVLSGLPHHSSVPRSLALVLAVTVVLAGVWMSSRGSEVELTRAAERKRLTAQRERLFADLVRLEHDARRGRVDRSKYASRREQLVSNLELVYGALDESDPPSPGEDLGGSRRARPTGEGGDHGAAASA